MDCLDCNLKIGLSINGTGNLIFNRKIQFLDWLKGTLPFSQVPGFSAVNFSAGIERLSKFVNILRKFCNA